MELWHDLAQFMNTEIVYTLKRLLPADLKVNYMDRVMQIGTDQRELVCPNFSHCTYKLKAIVWISNRIRLVKISHAPKMRQREDCS